jgi:uncharacterized protein YhbP (UPF0306 family)
MTARLTNDVHPHDRIERAVAGILRTNLLCSMATTGDSGSPHIHTAFFAFDDDLALYFLSRPDSTHARNVARHPEMAVSIFNGKQPWGGAHQGLQLFGRCAQTSGDADAVARRVYRDRFPLYDEFVSGASDGGPRPGSSFFQYRFFSFQPQTLKLLDELEFGDEQLVLAEVARAARAE